MKNRMLLAALLVPLIFAGCGAPQPPMPCTEQPLHWRQQVEQSREITFEYCEAVDRVCNEAVTLADTCPGFVSDLEQYFEEVLIPILSEKLRYLPWHVDIDRLADLLFDRLQGACGEVDLLDRIGTCQAAGDVGAPCAEDADCLEGLLCTDNVCDALPI